MRFQGIIDFIEANDRFILTAHETPDGDAIGSETALYRVLLKLGKQVRIYNADEMAGKYLFIDPDKAVQVLTEDCGLPEDLSEWVLIILDTNDTNNIGNVSSSVLPGVKNYFIFDHHESGENIVTGNLIESDASSTCELLYELFTEIGVEIDLETAQALYVGIVYDTGSFIYPKTTAKTFHIAEALVSMGVSPNHVYAKIYESNSISSLMLQSRVLSSLELYYDDGVAVQTMLKETLIECNAIFEEADTLINIPLKSEKIRVSVFFKENREGVLRCSMRSKGNINVAEIAQLYGGGGHKTAAGFKSSFPLETIKDKVLEMLKPYFS